LRAAIWRLCIARHDQVVDAAASELAIGVPRIVDAPLSAAKLGGHTLPFELADHE
jgi:hypothetical protein